MTHIILFGDGVQSQSSWVLCMTCLVSHLWPAPYLWVSVFCLFLWMSQSCVSAEPGWECVGPRALGCPPHTH